MKTLVGLNPFNLTLVFVGAIIMAIGLYRISPLPIGKGFILQNTPLVLMLIAGIYILCRHGGSEQFKAWLGNAGALGGRFLPLMIILCLVMGIGSVIAGMYAKEIQNFLLSYPVVGPFVAAFLAPTSNTFIPIVETGWTNAGTRPMLLFFMQASAMMSIPLFMMRQLGFAPTSPLPVRMYVFGIMIWVIILPFMRPLYWATDKICTLW